MEKEKIEEKNTGENKKSNLEKKTGKKESGMADCRLCSSGMSACRDSVGNAYSKANGRGKEVLLRRDPACGRP